MKSAEVSDREDGVMVPRSMMLALMIARVVKGVFRLMVLSSATRVGYGGCGVDGVEGDGRKGGNYGVFCSVLRVCGTEITEVDGHEGGVCVCGYRGQWVEV